MAIFLKIAENLRIPGSPGGVLHQPLAGPAGTGWGHQDPVRGLGGLPYPRGRGIRGSWIPGIPGTGSRDPPGQGPGRPLGLPRPPGPPPEGLM